MSTTIIVFTGAGDAHVPYVQKHLDRQLVRLDPAEVIGGKEYTYSLANKKFQVTVAGQPVDEVRAVWYRRPGTVQLDTGVVPDYLRDYAQRSVSVFSQLLCSRFADAFWLPDPLRDMAANDKTRQLEIAARLGFMVPDTILTSSKTQAAAFIARHDAVITKPLGEGYYQHDGKQYGFYASRASKDTDLSGLHLAPAIFQQALDVASDIRVTVVGTAVFAAAITVAKDKDTASHIRDWRAHDMDNRKVVAHDLPQVVADKCVAHVRGMGLHFGAIDLILDTKGRYWFLENNPNGQWAFVELVTGQPIGKAVAELLMRGPTSRT